MLNKIKKELYFLKAQLLFNQGIKEQKIVPFDEEFYEKMKHTYFNGIPISMHIKYLRAPKTMTIGKCYDRSLYMFFCFDDALLVRGDNKYLELRFGKENAGHGWIEIDDYVYDPTLLLRFDREVYYKIYNPTNVKRITKEEYIKTNGSYYDDVRNTKFSDFRPDGSKRVDLLVTIPLVKGIAECSHDEKFLKDLNEYLSLIQYDEKQLHDEMTKKLII